MIRVIAHAQKVAETQVLQAAQVLPAQVLLARGLPAQVLLARGLPAQVLLPQGPVSRSIDATVVLATLWFKRIVLTLLLCSMPSIAPAVSVLLSPVEVVAASAVLAPELRLGLSRPSPEHTLQWSEQRTDYEPEFLECAEDAEDDTPELSCAWFVGTRSATPYRAKTSPGSAYATFKAQRFATSARPRGPPQA